jgi:hypothetical protein
MSCKIVTVDRQFTAVVRAESPFDKLPETHRTSRATLARVLPTLDTGALGAGCTRWTPPANGKLPMEIGTIVAKPFASTTEVISSELPAGKAVHFTMKGPFDGLPGAWEKVFAWCQAEKLTPAGINWEIYGATQDAELYVLLS